MNQVWRQCISPTTRVLKKDSYVRVSGVEPCHLPQISHFDFLPAKIVLRRQAGAQCDVDSVFQQHVIARSFWFPAFVFTALLLGGCGSTPEASKTETTPPAVVTKESLFRQGHMLYMQQNLDSAHTLLNQALSIDPGYNEVLADLAPLSYDLAMRSDATKKKNELLRKSRDYYVKLESLGPKESDTYERLCEIANMLNDDKTFLKYAKKNAEAYPYDRQYYNLSVAYFSMNDFNGAIKAMKEATEKFKSSSYIGSFYRQLGRAYMKIDRDQTAEKIFYSGLNAVDSKIADLRKTNSSYKTSADYTRLKDDKIGMLISLKNLHTTYKATNKLEEVEKKLKELGR